MIFNRQINVVFAGFESSELRVEFEVTKSLVGYPNLGFIRIYNLKEDHRNQIEERFSSVQLFAGHDDLVLIFSGDIINVIHRYIKPDLVTEIYGGDSFRLLNESVVNTTIPAGSSMQDAMNILINEAEGLAKGITEGLQNCLSGKQSILKSIKVTGNLKEWFLNFARDCGFDYSINDGVIETTVKDHPLSDLPPVVINQNTGMIGSPERTDYGVTVKNLLLPGLKLGRQIEIKAITTELSVGNLFYRKVPPVRNEGVYRIDKLIHTGDTRGDTWQTEIHGRNF